MTTAVIEQLPLLASAPGGGAGLRRLILDLAVAGRLVPQAPADESAGELIARATAVKAAMGSTRKARGGASKSGPATWDHLPAGWVLVRLGELTTKLGAGSTPRGGKQVYTPEGVLFLRSQNVWNEGLRLDDVARIPAAIHADMAGTHVFAGDLLFNITGASIGRCAIVPSPFEGGNVSQHVVIVRPALPELQAYLHKVLTSDLVQDAVMAEQVGVSREGLSVAKLSEFKIPLPPLEEQHRIVAKVDELMALCDRLEARQQDAEAAHARLVQALLDSLTQARDADEFQACWQRLALCFESVLTNGESVEAFEAAVFDLAARGVLTRRESDDEPATLVLSGIAEHKVALSRSGLMRGAKSRPPIVGPVPFDLPNTWCWARWDEVAMKIGDIDHKMPEPDPNGVPFVSPRDFYPGNVIDFEGAKRVARADYERLSSKIRAERGDLIYPRYGTIGENVLVTVDREFLVSYSCAVIKVARGFIEPQYQFFVSLSGCIRRQAKAAENKTTQANVGIKSIQEFLFPVPPLAEQRRIVAKVNELLAICDQLKARIAAARAKHAQLAEALVAQAVAA